MSCSPVRRLLSGFLRNLENSQAYSTVHGSEKNMVKLGSGEVGVMVGVVNRITIRLALC